MSDLFYVWGALLLTFHSICALGFISSAFILHYLDCKCCQARVLTVSIRQGCKTTSLAIPYIRRKSLQMWGINSQCSRECLGGECQRWNKEWDQVIAQNPSTSPNLAQLEPNCLFSKFRRAASAPLSCRVTWTHTNDSLSFPSTWLLLPNTGTQWEHRGGGPAVELAVLGQAFPARSPLRYTYSSHCRIPNINLALS